MSSTRFSVDVVAPLVERHEKTLTADDLTRVMDEAGHIGLLASDTGDGLWGSSGSFESTVDTLRSVAAVNGGVAFGLHRQALGTWLRARLGLADTNVATAVSLLGHYGMGRHALPRLLGGRELDDTDSALLTDYFDLAAHSRVVVGSVWKSLLAAGFDGENIVWHVVDRHDCTVETRRHSHGFDELETATVSCAGAAVAATDTAAYVEALYLDHLGMTAIAAGLVDHSLSLARAYARVRRQGGKTIEEFPAVAQMLGNISSTARSARHYLAGFAAKRPGAEPFAELCGVRSTFHLACCVATNNGMQVLGGRGYMQDEGLEKLVRDANALRLLGGTPVELSMFVAEWERA
ncbi:acyl-CoA dehydrogenase family protein [Antrihabitans stalactiti]|uniref:Acyl-CoA dehydrogenase n=1 Tax=Antrihabitans stalactiti TaxID=2584121 RepID=A0A848K3N4_9NOCA|nr:acyl-CoA dehydrogenase family protein [Antrihabitans stalactiti]NMN93755.1 acyl-CoA dehydrogenase [Antrihabitans stalactiti]